MAFDRQIAGITIFCEASSEPHEARLGVAYTIINRSKVPLRFGATVAAVCLRRMQFSEWNDDAVDNRNLERAALAAEDDPVMLDCLACFDEALNGNSDPTHGATHYHDDSISPPSWTDGAIRTCKLGKLIFYRGVK